MDFSVFAAPEAWVSLLTLTFLEIVLGMDNIIFISIITGSLPAEEQGKARTIGLVLALVFRLALLFCIKWIIGLTDPVFSIASLHFSWRDIILLAGGIFLIIKSTQEIHHKTRGLEEGFEEVKASRSMLKTIMQIVVLDMVFSFDSILTAVGLSDQITVMVIAIVISMIIMLIFSGSISAFINKNPSLQMLALSFLILIGFTLVIDIEALNVHVPKEYIYFAVAFSFTVELLNMRMRRNNSKGKKTGLPTKKD